MNDALIIAGYAVLTASLMAGSFALGRWERRTIYKPGPPTPDPINHPEPMSPIPLRLADAAHAPVEESVRLVPRYPETDQIVQHVRMPEGDFLAKAQDVAAAVHGGRPWRNDWPPPGKFPNSGGSRNYILFPEEQEFWNEKLGDPTKKAEEG